MNTKENSTIYSSSVTEFLNKINNSNSFVNAFHGFPLKDFFSHQSKTQPLHPLVKVSKASQGKFYEGKEHSGMKHKLLYSFNNSYIAGKDMASTEDKSNILKYIPLNSNRFQNLKMIKNFNKKRKLNCYKQISRKLNKMGNCVQGKKIKLLINKYTDKKLLEPGNVLCNSKLLSKNQAKERCTTAGNKRNVTIFLMNVNENFPIEHKKSFGPWAG